MLTESLKALMVSLRLRRSPSFTAGVNSWRKFRVSVATKPVSLAGGGAGVATGAAGAAGSAGTSPSPGLYRPISSITRRARERLLSSSICVRSCSWSDAVP